MNPPKTLITHPRPKTLQTPSGGHFNMPSLTQTLVGEKKEKLLVCDFNVEKKRPSLESKFPTKRNNESVLH